MTSRILSASIALLLTPLSVHAVTDTWDGGGTNDLVSTNANWADNSAPVTNLATTDLVFGGMTRLSPNFADGFSMNKLTFNNTAGAFNLTGLPLNIGTGGIIDNDSDTQTISAIVIAGSASTTIDAASGGLHFAGGFFPNGKTISFMGAGNASMTTLNGPGAITKSGSGTFFIASGSTPISANLNVNAGTIQISANAAITQHFTNTVNVGPGSLVFNEYTTFDSTAQLNRTALGAGASVSIITNRELRFENGSDFNIAGSFTFSGGGRVTMFGPGSQLTATGGGTILIANNTTLAISDSGTASFTGASVFNVGVGSSGALTVSGVGSTLACGNTIWGGNASFATIRFSQAATASVQGVTMENASVQMTSGSSVTQSLGGLAINGASGNSTVVLGGVGTTWTQTGNFGVTVSGISGQLLVADGAVFTTGTAGATVNSGGALRIENGGTFSTPVNLRITGAGAEFFRDTTGVLSLPAGQTLQIEAGAVATFASDFAPNGIHVSATGTNSRLVAAANVIVSNGSTAAFAAGSRLDTTLNVTAGTGATTGTVTVSGSGSQLLAASTTWGSGGTGNLTLSNNATGTLGTTLIGSAALAGSTGVVQVLTGAAATSANLSIGTTPFTGNSGTLTLDGLGSSWTISGTNSLTIGTSVSSTGALTVRNGGAFNTGTGTATVRKTGTLAIEGGTLNANGDLFIDGGLLTRDGAGTLTFEPGKNVTVQNGGDITITGGFTNAGPGTAATIILTGSGSTFTTTGALEFRDNGDVLVDSGATLSAGAAALTLSSAADLIVDGLGASVGAGASTVGAVSGVSSLTLRNGGTGLLAGLLVGNSGTAGVTGNLLVQSGASLTVTGSGTTTVGATSGSIGTLTVESGGTFTTGTGLTEIRATGDLNINAGGTMIVRGNMTVATSLDIASGGKVMLNSAALPPAPALSLGNEWDFSALESTDPATVVPEPSIAMLFVSGLGLLGRQRTSGRN